MTEINEEEDNLDFATMDWSYYTDTPASKEKLKNK